MSFHDVLDLTNTAFPLKTLNRIHTRVVGCWSIINNYNWPNMIKNVMETFAWPQFFSKCIFRQPGYFNPQLLAKKTLETETELYFTTIDTHSNYTTYINISRWHGW